MDLNDTKTIITNVNKTIINNKNNTCSEHHRLSIFVELSPLLCNRLPRPLVLYLFHCSGKPQTSLHCHLKSYIIAIIYFITDSPLSLTSSLPPTTHPHPPVQLPPGGQPDKLLSLPVTRPKRTHCAGPGADKEEDHQFQSTEISFDCHLLL